MSAPAEFLVVLSGALVSRGWETDGPMPFVRTGAANQKFEFALGDGWSLRLLVGCFSRDVIEVSRWHHGMRYVVSVDAEVTVPAAEALGRRCGGPNIDAGMAPDEEFELPGDSPGTRQFRDADDHLLVAEEIVRYTEGPLRAWARERARVDVWLREIEELATDEPELLAWDVPVMLAAQGRPVDAQRYLAAARTSKIGEEFSAFATRLEEFMADPEAQADKEAPSAWPSESRDTDGVTRDPIRQAFYEAMGRELMEEPTRKQWRYWMRFACSNLRDLWRASREGGDLIWWAPVAYSADCEDFLEQECVPRRRGGSRQHPLHAELRNETRDSGTDTQHLEVWIRGRVVGFIRGEDLPEDLASYQLDGPKRVRLTRKNERPRFLVEVDLGS